jgi:hypothetical protein
MVDLALTLAVVISFAIAITSHAYIVAGLARRAPRWRAWIALFIPPLAPFWALRDGQKLRARIWIAAAALYSVLLVLARCR